MAVFWSRRVLLAGLAALVSAASLPAGAHYGWSSYDASKVIKAEVPIEAVRYQNPHGEIDVAYEGKRWLAILAPPSRMQARGLSKEDLTVGEVVTVEGYPKRNGEAEMRVDRITVEGKTIELR